MKSLKVLDLFSGIGGFSLGLERAGMNTVAFCEIDSFCQKVLKKHWPDVPIYNDVRNLEYEGSVDLICGGYPCQPFSVAGKKQGKNDERHLWPAMLECIKRYKPKWVVCENVKGHINNGLDTVLSDLENQNYTAITFCISAKSIGANHGRERIWIMAHTNSYGCDKGTILGSHGKTNGNEQKGQKKDFNNERCGSLRIALERNSYSPWKWGVKPPPFRMDDGIPNRMDRIKSLGNSILPQISEIIGMTIMEIENHAKVEITKPRTDQ